MNLKEYLGQATARIAREEFGAGDLKFTVEFALKRKSELEEALTKATVRKRLRDGTVTQDVNQEAVRKFLRDDVLQGWDGLTYGMVARMCNVQSPNGDLSAWKDKPVPYEPVNVDCLLHEARGMAVNDEGVETLTSFEGWLLGRVTRLADADARQEAAGKNA